jgi:hypothetical protein
MIMTMTLILVLPLLAAMGCSTRDEPAPGAPRGVSKQPSAGTAHTQYGQGMQRGGAHMRGPNPAVDQCLQQAKNQNLYGANKQEFVMQCWQRNVPYAQQCISRADREGLGGSERYYFVLGCLK